MNENEKYNGHTNYETWNFALWEDSDYWNERAQECYDNATSDKHFTRLEQAKLDLRDVIQDYIDELQEMQETPVTGFFADILGAAIQRIDTFDLADTWMSDVEEEEEEEED